MRLSPARQYVIAALAAGVATLACMAIDGAMSVAGLALVYLLAVVGTAALLDRGPGIAASLICVSALNFFFVPPRYSFEIDGAEYWWTLAVLLALSVWINGLVASLRARRANAEEATARAAQLHGLGEALAVAGSAEEMARQAARWLHGEIGHGSAVFLRRGSELRCLAAGADESAFQPSAAQWAIDHGRPLGRGCDDWNDLPLWCAPFARHASSGAVMWLLHPDARPARELQQHWLALARQVGLAIERESAAQAARDAAEAAQAEAARNTLLASLSHDLRTPLAALMGTASTLRAQAAQLPAAEREKLLASLEDESRDLTAMADNILQLARLSQPQAQLRRQWESVEEVLGAAVSRMRKRWPAARIQLRVTPGLPPIDAEAALLAQAIANLVDNAVRHSPEPARIEIAAGKSRGGIFIALRDHGVGIDAAAAAALFEPYKQGTRRDTGAAGLGLAICKLVVEAHGGAIAVRACDPGTEFRIDLPAHEVEAATP
jgi:two-component system sensor histidine kinase KdpD